MDLSDLRGLDAVLSAALAALGGRSIYDALKGRERAGEIAGLRKEIAVLRAQDHELRDKMQAEMLKRAVLEVEAKSHIIADDEMHERVLQWMEKIEGKLDRLLSRGQGL